MLLTTGSLLLAPHYWLTTGYWLLAPYYWLTTGYFAHLAKDLEVVIELVDEHLLERVLQRALVVQVGDEHLQVM